MSAPNIVPAALVCVSRSEHRLNGKGIDFHVWIVKILRLKGIACKVSSDMRVGKCCFCSSSFNHKSYQ